MRKRECGDQYKEKDKKTKPSTLKIELHFYTLYKDEASFLSLGYVLSRLSTPPL
jgi:hypothetical protein